LEVLSVHAFSTARFDVFDVLRKELAADSHAQELRAQIVAWSALEGWAEVDGLLLFQGKAFVLDSSSLWPQLLEDAYTAWHELFRKHFVAYVCPSSVC
jgi:hypothetical protein